MRWKSTADLLIPGTRLAPVEEMRGVSARRREAANQTREAGRRMVDGGRTKGTGDRPHSDWRERVARVVTPEVARSA